jgi:uncharacterized protein (DUF2336 family)
MNNQIVSGEKYLWKIAAVDQQKVAAIASRYNLSFGVAQVLLKHFCSAPLKIVLLILG